MATQSFTISQLNALPNGYTLDGSELIMQTVLSGAELRSVKTSLYQLSSYYVPQSEWKDSQTSSGNIVSYGTIYLNGDTRERIYASSTADANVVRGSLAVDNLGVSYDKYLHSGNIYADTKNKKIYFPRGTWPRRHAHTLSGSDDKDAWTWRELGGSGEAICRVNYDGTGFEVVKDLAALGSEYYDPCAVVYDDVHDYIFFACRNDHNKSRIYRMDQDGSNLVLWLEMATNNINIDCLDIAHIPQDFFAVNNPSCTTTYLYFGTSPDYDKTTNTTKFANAAVLRIPVIGNAPGLLSDDYIAKYVVHRFWHSSYKDDLESVAATPSMKTTGVKGIKVFIANTNTNTAQPTWDTSTVPGAVGYGLVGKPGSTNKQWSVDMSKDAVARDRSRIYVVHSGSRNVKRDHAYISTIVTSGDQTAPAIPDTPSSQTVYPTKEGYGYGGNSVFELLVGEPSGGTASFSPSDDANRPYKTWREGDMFASGGVKAINMGNDDPSHPTTTIGSGVGAGRSNTWITGDYLYISTSPSQTSYANGAAGFLDAKSGRGVKSITSKVPDSNTYAISDTDGTTDGPGEAGKVMVIPVIMSGIPDLSDSGYYYDLGDDDTIGGSQFGLQQLTVNPCTMEIFVADFFASAYYLIQSSDQTTGGDAVAEQLGNPEIAFIPATNPNPTIPGAMGTPLIPGNPLVPGNPPIPAGPYNSYQPGYPPVPSTNPTPATTGTNPTPGNPGAAAVPAVPMVPPTPAVPAGVGQSYLHSQPDDSYYGTIWRADAFVYCRGRNGRHIFDRFNHVGYNRPCGLTGYLVGPWNEFRLVYTNGETHLLTDSSLISDVYTYNLAARGREINGLSQVFTRHNVLAAGKNVWSMYDFGTGTTNGIVITMQNAAASSDYAVLAQASNGDTVTVPTINYANPAVGANNYEPPGTALYGQSNAAAQQWLVDDASMYQAKSTKQFRLCYPDVMSPWNVEPYKSGTSLNAEPSTIRKSVNTLFFAVIQ